MSDHRRKSGDSPLNYVFAPIPRRAVRAVADGRLSSDEFLLVSIIYARADRGALARREATVRMRPSQIVDATGWTDDWATIYKRIRRLAGKPERWYSVESDRRKGADVVYVFTPHPDDPEGVSEASPKLEPRTANGAANVGSLSPSGVAATPTSDRLDRPDTVASERLSEPTGRVSEVGVSANPHEEWDRGVVDSGAVRCLQTFSEGEPCSDGGTRFARERARAREDDDLSGFLPEVREAVERARREQAARERDGEAAP